MQRKKKKSLSKLIKTSEIDLPKIKTKNSPEVFETHFFAAYFVMILINLNLFQ